MIRGLRREFFGESGCGTGGEGCWEELAGLFVKAGEGILEMKLPGARWLG